MRLAGIKLGDIVRVDDGLPYLAEVTGPGDRTDVDQQDARGAGGDP